MSQSNIADDISPFLRKFGYNANPDEIVGKDLEVIDGLIYPGEIGLDPAQDLQPEEIVTILHDVTTIPVTSIELINVNVALPKPSWMTSYQYQQMLERNDRSAVDNFYRFGIAELFSDESLLLGDQVETWVNAIEPGYDEIGDGDFAAFSEAFRRDTLIGREAPGELGEMFNAISSENCPYETLKDELIRLCCLYLALVYHGKPNVAKDIVKLLSLFESCYPVRRHHEDERKFLVLCDYSPPD